MFKCIERLSIANRILGQGMVEHYEPALPNPHFNTLPRGLPSPLPSTLPRGLTRMSYSHR